MAIFTFNGTGNQAVPFNPATDVLNILPPVQGWDIATIRNEGGGTSVLVQTINGASITLLGVIVEQLTDANINATFGDFDIGDNGNNNLAGSIVLGLAGNDDIEGTFGSNFLQGNAGNDYIDGNGGMDRIRGGEGNDDLDGFGTGSVVYGDRGNDEIDANWGDANSGVTIFGGNGNPSDPADGNDDIEGSYGNDTIQGNGGNDHIHGLDGHDFIRGGQGDDELRGDYGNDTLMGDLGNDDLDGNDNEDSLFGGIGNDDLSGDDGDDIVSGGAGNDFVDGGIGADVLSGHGVVGDTDQNIFFFERDGDFVNAVLWAGSGASAVRGENFSGPGGSMPTPTSIDLEVDDLFDWISDLNLGGSGLLSRVDVLDFEDWDVLTGDTFTETIGTANNLQTVINARETSGGDDHATLVHVTGGVYAGKSFLLVDTDGGDGLEYIVQVTGVTGTFDDSDMI